jgi:hypothetical protein
MTRPDCIPPNQPDDLLIPLGAMITGDDSELSVEPLLKQRRDTAAGCRDRAASSHQHAGTMTRTSDRMLLEDSAESWTARADLLQRLETANAAVMDVPVLPVLTGKTNAQLPPIAASPNMIDERAPL